MATGNVAQFTAVDDTPTPSFFIEFMDIGNAQETVVTLKARMRARLGDLTGEAVLDLGSGTGDDARRLAEATGPTGQVLGIDASEAMVAEARRRAAGSGLP